MVVYTLEQRWKVGMRSTYRRCRFWQKKSFFFSNEAHFDLSGYVNKQNCRIWGTENPHVYIENPTHPKRVTVWLKFWCRGIIGTFFYENEQGQAVTVNSDRYWAMLNEFLFTKIEEENIGNIWFQKEGATCHAAEATLDVLHPVFEDRIICRRADVVWPPRSCNFTLLDYYLWDDVKDKCYADKPEKIDALKDNIRKAIGEIQLHISDNVPKNCTDRVGYCMASRGSHFNGIILHYETEGLYFQINVAKHLISTDLRATCHTSEATLDQPQS